MDKNKCSSCGETKCSCKNKDFTKAVIEINNPEQITLMRRVVIPASMGDDTTVPPVVGKYKNVLLFYEANKHVYLYSSDGIPTLLETDVPQELLDKVAELDEGLSDLEQEFDEFKNSPDVVDIVATYADLQAYDTSDLGDKDVIRVLTDETHDNESSYYRWSTATNAWTFIGATGPYYTKDETDTIVDAAKGKAKELTAEDYDWPTVNPDGVAVWALSPGFYHAVRGVKMYWTSASQGINIAPYEFIIAEQGNSGDKAIFVLPDSLYTTRADGSVILDTVYLKSSQVVDSLTSTAASLPLSAKQGKVLNEKITAGLGKAKTLSAADYNVNSANWADTDPENFNAVALCRLDPGYYIVPSGVNGYVTSTLVTSNTKTYLVGVQGTYGVLVAEFSISSYARIGVEAGKFYSVLKNDGSSTFSYLLAAPIDRLDQPNTSHPLSANQGMILNSKIIAMNSANSYSAVEVDTGTTWLGGDKIYKKTINTGALPNATASTVPHGITGLNRIIKAEGCAYDTSLNLTITTGTMAVDGNNAVIIASNLAVGWGTTTNLSNYTESYVTLYYTKN